IYNGRNRTFFFAEYEGVRQSNLNSSLAAVFPTAYRTGDLSAIKTAIKDPLHGGGPIPNNVIPSSELSPQAQKILAYMPLPNLTTTAANNYLASPGFGNVANQTLDRVDQNLGEKTRLFFRVAWQN